MLGLRVPEVALLVTSMDPSGLPRFDSSPGTLFHLDTAGCRVPVSGASIFGQAIGRQTAGDGRHYLLVSPSWLSSWPYGRLCLGSSSLGAGLEFGWSHDFQSPSTPFSAQRCW